MLAGDAATMNAMVWGARWGWSIYEATMKKGEVHKGVRLEIGLDDCQQLELHGLMKT